MQFTFDPSQEYQRDAIQAVVDLFEGQPPNEPGLFFDGGESMVGVIANRLDLYETALLANLRAVQARNGLPPDDELMTIGETIASVRGPLDVRFPNITIEMETGTGKTYVYLRTALELFTRYGFRKFIIVVPSVAVREGVLKTLAITREHFRSIHGNTPYSFAKYDSAAITQVADFARSDSVKFLVMTIDAFNKAQNVIRQPTDLLQGATPIHLLQSCRPILILDEPQNMESEKSVAALATLHPLIALRYSATHRNPYNLVYRLTPYDAYRQRLVKRIQVDSITRVNDDNTAFLRLDSMSATRNTVTARVTAQVLQKTGTVRERTFTVRWGDDLEQLTNRPEYAGYIVEEINRGQGFTRFENGVEIRLGETVGEDREAIFRLQIRRTIEEHFRNQQRLKSQGIKALSLFFIDRVANYAPEDSLIKRLFREAFDDLKPRYPDWREADAATVQAAYFAKKGKDEREELLDSTSTANERDEAAFDLIMRSKERLLSFDEPVAFLFSHSALREGWDNPNVFQICTLKQAISPITKRQEIGRGVRLAVNQDGDRVRDESVNVLTVIASESYERYVAELQAETEREYGQTGVAPPPEQSRDKTTVTLRKEYRLLPGFEELWRRIAQKTRYAVRIDSDTLIERTLSDLDVAAIPPPRYVIKRIDIEVGESDAYRAGPVMTGKTMTDLSGTYSPLAVVATMTHLLAFTTPAIRLTRRTLLAIVNGTAKREAMRNNPHGFAAVAVAILKRRLADMLVNGIQYEKIDDWYEMSQFETEIETWKAKIEPADHSIYDAVMCDSDIERRFVQGLEARKDVKLYIKLPAWFTVPTPIGAYNPDWAIVLDETDAFGQPTERLYLVRETKSTVNTAELAAKERRKVLCGAAHFGKALGVDFRVVTDPNDLFPDSF